MSEIKLSAIEKTSLIFGEKISSMIINNTPHSEISEEINSERNSNIEYNWELIGDHIVSIIQTQELDFFAVLDHLDFSMQIFEIDGENSIHKRFQVQYELAERYSDQAGLSRKFHLYEDLVEGSYSRMKGHNMDNDFYDHFICSLLQLALLSRAWEGDESSELLFRRLIDVMIDAKDEAGISVIEDIKNLLEKGERDFEDE